VEEKLMVRLMMFELVDFSAEGVPRFDKDQLQPPKGAFRLI
jgi:hypothetical protein